MSWFSNFLSSGLGSLIGGGLSYAGQHSANQTNRDIARETNQTNRDIANSANVANAKQLQSLMSWQENLSNTSYQRSMADMKKAGLNPMLAAMNGGAGTPAGAAIPSNTGAGAVTGAPMQNEMSGVGPAVNSAIDAMRTKYEIQNMKETAKNLQETNKQIVSSTALNNAMRKSAAADASLKTNSAKKVGIDIENAKLDQVARSVEAAIDKTKFGIGMRFMGRLNPLGSTTSAAKDVAMILR